MLGKLVNEVLVEDAGQVSFLDFRNVGTVPDKQEVIDIVGPEVTVVVVVSGHVTKFNKQIGDSLTDCTGFDSCFLLTGKPFGCRGNVYGDSLFADVGLIRTDEHIVGRAVDDFLGVSNPALHDRVKLGESSLRCKSSLGEVLIDRKGNLPEVIQHNCLYLRCTGTVKGKQVGCLGIISPSIGVQAVSCIVKLLVTIKATINFCHVNESGFGPCNVISKHLLADNHVVDGSKDFILSQLPSKICHILFFLLNCIYRFLGTVSTVILWSSFVKMSGSPSAISIQLVTASTTRLDAAMSSSVGT